MSSNEILLEKLHLLQVHNLALEENRAFNSLILNGLDAILKNDKTETLLTEFFDILQQAIAFSAAILIKINPSNETTTLITASHPQSDEIITQLKALNKPNRDIKNVFNLHQLPDWQVTDPFWHSQHAMLTTPVSTSTESYQLYIFSETIGAFNQHDITLMQRFVSFAGNTISQFEKRNLLVKQKEMEEKQSNIEQVLINSEKMASLGQMAAGVAHEINNPLSYIVSNIQNLAYNLEQFSHLINTLKAEKAITQQTLVNTLQHYQFDELQTDSSDIIAEMTEGADRVKEIVQGLRQFAHPDQTQIGDIDITELIDNTLRVAWNEIKYNANVEKNYNTEPVIITGRSTQLSQVFLNLFFNAAQAICDKVGVISITTKADKKNAYITIADNGSGIDEDKLNKIFDPFYTTKPIGQGTGLGLAISKAIIEQHSGQIRVESQLNQGTVFYITLPKKPKLTDDVLTILNANKPIE
ncbi:MULTISPECIES: ATP-binding protein [unclassified Pseudoalteromonas]|uniref:sensor histidine kinase n=1 Tax=unclassified Pseudoalteromonas TaxID=194690 RepID=UPI00110CF06D|nr:MULTISPECIES: ATP-binding protein [unclassified Pseudoalteromonas]MDN3395618.1 ATP-binding protein [Pseudoalteromonas sp. APC 3215]MDN3399882.1 ATP-binding protein [Pseudoalteromonas sp. APC 3213]MDN3429768.1 ATP-binding protein [Pseudoalteromonas sp. APC 3907]MDN3465834.1 ATP-binding protein [Pseudoalteromonas sp. APC 3495]MDN3471347.1 ATP-binding protein [Pseudoalteromonas sp. APC 4026]